MKLEEKLSSSRLLSIKSVKEALEMIDNSPTYYLQGIEAASSLREGSTNPRSVIIYGLGGSGMAGYAASSMFSPICQMPLIAIRDARIPAWIRSDDLLVLISYSGETFETLLALREGASKGPPMIAITSGGRLAEEAKKRSIPLILVPRGLPPRMALPYMLGSVAGLLSMLDIAREAAMELKSAAEKLKVFRESLWAFSDDNVAKAASMHIYDSLPHVACSQHLVVAGYRMKSQLNENAKYPCIVHEIPEAMHNEIEAMPYTQNDKYLTMRSISEPRDIGAQYDFLKSMLGDRLFEVFLNGGRIYESTAAIMISDYLSIYVAALRGVDPIPVERITSLRQYLKSKDIK